MSKRNDLLLVDDILQSLQSIVEYTTDLSFEEFVISKITIDAVIRNFEICGEASNYLSEEFKLLHPQIEWRKLSDFRNRLIHHYFGISHDIVWTVITTEVPDYIDFLESIK
jgi:uncharacterized protein with HEPN domain